LSFQRVASATLWLHSPATTQCKWLQQLVADYKISNLLSSQTRLLFKLTLEGERCVTCGFSMHSWNELTAQIPGLELEHGRWAMRRMRLFYTQLKYLDRCWNILQTDKHELQDKPARGNLWLQFPPTKSVSLSNPSPAPLVIKWTEKSLGVRIFEIKPQSDSF
jgi:hypothetical protein